MPLSLALGELECQPHTLDHAKRLITMLECLDTEYKTHHYSIVDLTDNEGGLATEQAALDDHDENIAKLGICVQRLIAACFKSLDSNPHKIASKQLARLKASLSRVEGSISSDADNTCPLKQHEEQLSEF